MLTEEENGSWNVFSKLLTVYCVLFIDGRQVSGKFTINLFLKYFVEIRTFVKVFKRFHVLGSIRFML